MSMVNLKKTFEDCAAKMGDRLISAVVGFHYDDKDTYESYAKQFPVEPWADASTKIDYEYNSGFGGADCHAVIAWGNRFVYFVHEYDGATGIQCVPRNPEPCAPSWADVEQPSPTDIPHPT
jgi:hypothetical protein